YDLDAASAAAEFEQSGHTIDLAFDGVQDATGWAVNDGLSDPTSQTREACAQLTTGTTPDYTNGATTVRFVLRHLATSGVHYLGKFKLYVTSAPKTAFANGASDCNLAEDGHSWVAVEPTSSVTNVPGLTLSENTDDSLVVNACPSTTGGVTFTITGTVGIDQITGVRIQAIDDDAATQLPTGGPGCAGNGNFVLSEVLFSADSAAAHCPNTTVSHDMFSGPLSYTAPAGCKITGFSASGGQWNRWSYDGGGTYWQGCNDLSGGTSDCTTPMSGRNATQDAITCNYDNPYNDNRGTCTYNVTLAPK
ncbi:MAG TPA: hypothetical protein VFZ09_11130, partial [Archangium sp.]|uniref:hypothetical protein n=1 Tax=Archangium sp. TaxID=1872627 RepID=UPI002E30C3EE